MQKDEQRKQCDNCHKMFPSDKIDLHEAYCFRNIKKCPKCQKMAQQHTNKKCQICNQSMSVDIYTNHPQKCPKKPVSCQFCENNYALAEIQKHKQVCGSRTRACQICQRFITIRQIQEHESRCQRRVEERRNQISQDVNRNHNRVQNRPSSRQRQTSQNVRQKRQKSTNRIPTVVPKNHKIKPSHMIGPQTIKPVIDPVPISIRLAMKMKQQQRIPLQSKN